MWQFVQFRGREYGLNQTPATDDRMDPEKATRSAARHLRDLYAQFGDWYLAMSAYNCGPNCVDHAVQRTGYADFWELRRLNALPKDTNNYVPVILALTIMAKNPKDYDLENLDLDQPVEYDTMALEVPTSLAIVADSAERPLAEIQELNPALLKPVAPAGYQLRVPKGSSAGVLMALEAVPLEHRANWRIHKVSQGETIAEIAHHFATTAASITAVNQPGANHPEAGELLAIPVGYPVARTTARPSKAVAQSRTLHRAAASKKLPAPAPVHRAEAGTFKTASLTAKHRPAAN
jgi:membrane-bound lytic murein transglycosylase D